MQGHNRCTTAVATLELKSIHQSKNNLIDHDFHQINHHINQVRLYVQIIITQSATAVAGKIVTLPGVAPAEELELPNGSGLMIPGGCWSPDGRLLAHCVVRERPGILGSPLSAVSLVSGPQASKNITLPSGQSSVCHRNSYPQSSSLKWYCELPEPYTQMETSLRAPVDGGCGLAAAFNRAPDRAHFRRAARGLATTQLQLRGQGVICWNFAIAQHNKANLVPCNTFLSGFSLHGVIHILKLSCRRSTPIGINAVVLMYSGSGGRRRGAPDSPGGALRTLPHGLVPLRHPPRPAQRLAPPPVRSHGGCTAPGGCAADFG